MTDLTGDVMDDDPGEVEEYSVEYLVDRSQEESLEDLVIRRNTNEGLTKELSKVLDTLHPREAGVIRARFGLGDTRQKTLDEISEEFGVTFERIRQIESKTMSKLRHPLRSQALREFLDGV
jgi:RNA polymerase sigma factor (sigma-70 family)